MSVATDPLRASVEDGLRSDDGAERTFRRSIMAALGVGLIALLGLIVTSVILFQNDQAYSRWVDHTYATEARVSRLGTLLERMETVRRGYLLGPDPTYWTTYQQTRAEIPVALDEVGRLTIDNPRQQGALSLLRQLIDGKFAQMRETLELAHDGDVETARRNYLAHKSQRLTLQVRAVLAAMQTEERKLLANRARRERDAAFSLEALSVGVALVLVLLAIGATLLVRRYAGDLGRSQIALRRLNEGLEGAVRERTAELTRANDEIQRFAYIVSHDLRSPLVNVMGFTSELEAGVPALQKLLAEADEKAPGLVGRDARSMVVEEIPEAIGFIRSSTRKMDRLINAILKLSREGRRTLNPEPLDMTALAHGVADSLKRLADDRGAQIVVAAPLADLVSDRVAIEQVVSNLTENAVKYLSADRAGRIEIAARAQGERVLVEVADNGRGIAPNDHERVFELFRRSGAQDQPGEGIGLAHVRALVYRLGGTITVDSELGRGSTFRVDLPRRLQRDEGHAA